MPPPPKTSYHNLGAILDLQISFHIQSIKKSYQFYLQICPRHLYSFVAILFQGNIIYYLKQY